MRAMGRTVLDAVIGWIGGLEDAPAENTADALQIAAKLEAVPAEQGDRDFGGLLEDAIEAARHTYEFSGPGYLAYIPGGGLFTAALAEFLAHALNRFDALWQPSPAVVQIEENVTRWMCSLFDFPIEASQGLLTTGGSLANLSAFVTARHAKLGEDFLDGTYYCTDQTHASNTKAATIAGFSRRNLRLVPTDLGLRMDPDALRSMVREDRAAGRRPFLVIPAVGTTNTGAVDPLADIADVVEAEGLWMHVDGAYGGFFQLTDRGRERFRGIERADSVTLDPHKGLFLPYGTGGLVVRDGETLRAGHHVGAIYLQDLTPGALPDFADYSPELSRELRGLRVWLPLQLHGVSAFRDALDEKLDLARAVHEALAAMPELELPWETELSVVAFRHRDGDDAGRRLLERVNASRRVFLSSTTVDGRFVVRVCILSHRTHRDRVEEAIELIRSAV